ncbi:YbaN family protein [Thalassorhabdomicrobium marinisediminis]|uniref:YbaN family protein n=1 Tax=Thalassorhabdomicrobium marinisediminis TaxID=2170577 RepID=UPI002493A0F8|nr:YbaN family protein [Thalassorhabdomicrobium marinisediminis]
MTRAFWFLVGFAALVVGAIGVVLPLLPTTPLVILAAFAFGKSSTRVESWLLTSRTFGPLISDWRENGAIAPRIKVIACTMMAVVFVLSLVLGASAVVLTIQALCLTGAAAFVLSRPGS